MSFNHFIVLSTLISCTIYCAHAADITGYIINGNEAINGSYPWQLSFQRRGEDNKWYHTCGAVLIDERWALTASHCIYNSEKNKNGTYDSYKLVNMRVVAGAHRIAPLDWDGSIHYIAGAITPYGLNVFFDVALLKLQTAANISRADISPIAVAKTEDYYTGRQCWVTGWGTSTRVNPRFTPILREAAMTLVTHKECRGEGWGVASVQTCATGSPRQNTACFGDSGGPLSSTRDDGTPILMGISSFVYKTCQTGRPNVFGKASVYRKWLRRLTEINDL